MKFAAKVVLFLSSSFAFVKGEEVICNAWPCPDDSTRLVVVQNSLTTIPTEIGQLTLLEHFVFYSNSQLTGSIPSEIGLLTGLQYLEIAYNDELTGSIPSEIGLLNALIYLSIDTNSQLTGIIPTEIGRLSALTTLQINTNWYLTGSIPEEIGGLVLLTELIISENYSLSSSIPTEIGQLTLLELLWIENNPFLYGSLPSEIGGLVALTWLEIENNPMLTGSIPELPPNLVDCFIMENGFSDVCEALDKECIVVGEFDTTTCAPDDTPAPTKNPTSTPSSTPSKNPTPSPTYASAPDFDIVLVSCDFIPGTTDVGDIVCEFDGKGGVGHDITSALYAASDCEGSAPTGVVQDTDTTFDSALESGSETQEESTYSATISLANSAVPTDATSIDFCLKVEVEDSNGDVYDWIGQKITLNVDLDGSFSTESDLTTTPFDGNTDINDIGTVTFGVTAYRCDETGETSSDSILELGENFFLCVEGEQDAVIINDIDSLGATKDDDNDDTDLALITGGNPNSNTFVYGKESEKVVVATRLPATFFEDDGAVTLEGTADIVTGGGTRKLAQVRIMQESPQSADFSMTVEVESSSAASLSVFGVAAAFGLVAALVL